MTDYSKLKVTELKEELKRRSIPLTGLKVKQNFIDKLREADAVEQASKDPATNAAAGDEATSAENAEVVDSKHAAAAEQSAPSDPVDQGLDHPPGREEALEAAVDGKNAAVAERTAVSDPMDQGLEHQPPRGVSPEAGSPSHSPKEEESKDAQAEVAGREESSKQRITQSGDEEMDLVPAQTRPHDEEQDYGSATDLKEGAGDAPEALSLKAAGQHFSQPISDHIITPRPTPTQPSYTNTPSSGPIPPVELLEDSRKRKRRSSTPPPSTIEVAQKKARASDGGPSITQDENSLMEEVPPQPQDSGLRVNGHEHGYKSLNEDSPADNGPQLHPQDEPASTVQEREQSPRNLSPPPHSERPHETELPPEPQPEEQSQQIQSPVRSKPRSPNLLRRRPASPPKPTASDEHHVTPAVHPATSALYMRNFKRPLHIPSLRSYISALATSPNDNDENRKDPITSFYLDSIRTHGFVCFNSITAASRARSALHESRFPDEKTREPLWVDFVPEEQVEGWIETEQRGNADGRIGRRWEVVYQEGFKGVEATLQEVGTAAATPAATAAPYARPPHPSSISTMTTRGPDASAALPTPGIHPDRARLVPQHDDQPRTSHRKESVHQQQQQQQQQQQHQPDRAAGTGFQALDDLFPSTKAKPKLYYKAVDAVVAEDRLDLLRDLRDLGGARSGDPDMRRYSFALERGRDEWVDKGPEFGYGARGRAVERGGGARGLGGYSYGGRGGRGGGGGGGGGGIGRGGDTWRAGGRY